jgi:hypothetical protein
VSCSRAELAPRHGCLVHEEGALGLPVMAYNAILDNSQFGCKHSRPLCSTCGVAVGLGAHASVHIAAVKFLQIVSADCSRASSATC